MHNASHRCLYRVVAGLIVVGLGLTLGGCRAGHTYVLDTPQGTVSCGAIAVREGRSKTMLDAEQKASFESELEDALDQPFETADETPGGGEVPVSDGVGLVTLEYRVVLHEQGNGPVRMGAFLVSLLGVPVSNMGEGNVGIEATFIDDRGEQLAHIVVDGPIDGPVAGTGWGLSTAIEQISAFARERFRYVGVKKSAAGE